MTPDNYERFVAAFEEKGDKSKFFLEPFGKFDNMVTLGKVRAKDTTYIEESLVDYVISHNVYLDIFILHTCPDGVFKRVHQYIWAKYIIAKAQSVRDLSRYGFVLRTALKILFFLVILFFIFNFPLKVYLCLSTIILYHDW